MNRPIVKFLVWLASPSLPFAHLLAGSPAVSGSYILDAASVAAGGIGQRSGLLGKLMLSVSSDLWSGATLYGSLMGTHGFKPSEWAGDAQVSDNIEAPDAFRPYEFWIEQHIGEASVKVGLYDLNSEFDAEPAAGLLLNSSYGIGYDFGQSGLNGPSIFPVTSPAVKIQYVFSERFIIRAAALDGVPGDPERPRAFRIRINREEGALLIAETAWSFGSDPETRLVLGGWGYSEKFEKLNPSSATDVGGKSRGVYFRAAHPLWSGGEKKIESFARFGAASAEVNPVARCISAGVNFSGFLPGSPDNHFGFAAARAEAGEPFKSLQNGTGAETSIEATARFGVGSVALQPDVQWIFNPGFNANLDAALVVTLRMEFKVE